MPQKNVQNVEALSGLAPAYAAAANDDFIQPAPTDDKLLLHVKNGDAAAHTLTIDDVRSVAPAGAAAFNPDVSVEIPAGGERMIQLVQLQRFKDRDTGQIAINWSAITGMSLGVFRLR